MVLYKTPRRQTETEKYFALKQVIDIQYRYSREFDIHGYQNAHFFVYILISRWRGFLFHINVSNSVF